MPQIDFSTYMLQISWLAVFFMMIYMIISKLFVPKMSKIFEDRKAKINETLAASEAMLIECKALDSELHSTIENGKLAAISLKQHAKAEAKTTLEVSLEASEKEVAKVYGRSVEKIKRMEEKVREEIPNIVDQIILEIQAVLSKQYDFKQNNNIKN